MSTRPGISIVLPVFNGAKTLSAAVRSLQAQTHENWELLLVDDGSTDGTGALAVSLAIGDPRIRVFTEPHRGLVGALQAGCGWARGEFLARMDSDDVAHPTRLARQLGWFVDHPRGGICGTGVRMTGVVGPGRRRYEAWLNALRTHEELTRELFVECPIAHPTFMMRRDTFETLGGYREFNGPEDYDLVFRFWHGGYEIGNVPEILLDWRDGPDRLSMNSPRYSEAAFRRLKRYWLEATRIRGKRPLYQWGAGEVGKRWLREWPAGSIDGVADIRPSKIGQRIHGFPVIRPESLPSPGTCFFVVAVGTPGARDDIRKHAGALGFEECRDYIFVA